ncbi:hypothetical protein SAVERM_7103 [Streptomyces avermitilis MA-4680 = NBRC 14893]|uniref:Uncharacterized protein n=1 Tax=Streptomyces avermitilis (strain ATCC 31267 / DSM 46492 / JCM 5070 / NBRC 14893 / NCIMB 12804 / NRRL 8165 / MA-4680) TaxID=227882 RepID=Q826S2_STRAW|nr:hypothetical protein SAVERM_7103 [Streptomyces avermitilis MA-4680 = NBRC 14893]
MTAPYTVRSSTTSRAVPTWGWRSVSNAPSCRSRCRRMRPVAAAGPGMPSGRPPGGHGRRVRVAGRPTATGAPFSPVRDPGAGGHQKERAFGPS